jgi:hypothetical protein
MLVILSMIACLVEILFRLLIEIFLATERAEVVGHSVDCPAAVSGVTSISQTGSLKV